jgi:hypothetical protein
MTIDAVSLAAILKEVYPDGLPNEFLYKRSPFLALIKKDTEALMGDTVKIPTNYGNPQGVGADFTQARANITDQLNSAFKLTHKNYYGFATISGESIDKSKTDRGSFVRVLTSTIEKTKYTMGRMHARYMLTNGSGVLGQISSTSNVGTPTITLANPSDARWFEVGMKLVANVSDAASGGALRSAGATVTLTAVDRALGNLTASGNWSAGIGAVVAGDYLFRQGDWQAVMSGYEAWIPRTAPGATAFFGVDRSVDTRLGGLRATLTDRNIIEGVQDALELLHREDSAADFGVLQSQDWMALSKALQSDGSLRTSMLESDTAGVGFKAIEVMGPAGMCKIISDPNALKGRFFAGQLDTWTFYSMGDAIKLLDNDGNVTLRQGSSDGVELQLVGRIQMGCEAPGWNGNFDIAGA